MVCYSKHGEYMLLETEARGDEGERWGQGLDMVMRDET